MPKFVVVSCFHGNVWWADEAATPDEVMQAMVDYVFPDCEITDRELYYAPDDDDSGYFAIYRMPDDCDIDELTGFDDKDKVRAMGGKLIGYWCIKSKLDPSSWENIGDRLDFDSE